MRATRLIAAALISIAGIVPTGMHAQVSVRISIGAPLGPPVPVFGYAPARGGPWRDAGPPLAVEAYAAGDVGGWRTHLMFWTPVTVYDLDGAYYARAVPGSRSVEIYRYHDRYFLPPADRAWLGADRRYDYRRRPAHDDDDDDGPGRAHGRGRGHGHGGD